MREVLLTTKLRVPRLPVQHVPRAHLVALLERGVAGSLTLLSAPAGSGKTTLLTEWARTTRLPVAWLSLESADSEPTRLLAYLLAALQTLDAHIGQQTEELPDMLASVRHERLLYTLINDLASYLPTDVALVLDDYHTLQNEAAHQILTFLLEHAPEHLHLVFGTRVDPPLPLARLRARGQLSEIHAETLRFTAAEVESFFQAMELELGEDALHTLEARTEGWIAGVQLAALALRGRTDPAAFINRFRGNHRFILEYIGEEILTRQIPQVRAFLLQTSILERLSGSLCDAVIAGSGSQTMLEELRRANLFVSSLDESGEWYRYHALFAESLHHQLVQQEPELLPQLCTRASIWYEKHEMFYEACEYALRARDFTRAVPLLERLVSRLVAHIEFSVLGRWLDQLPADIIEMRPLLRVAQTWVLLASDERRPEQFEPIVAQLQEHFQAHMAEEDHAEWAEAHANLNFMLIMYALGGKDAEKAISLAQQTLALLPEDATYLRKQAAFCITLAQGTAHRLSGDFASAERVLHAASIEAQPTDFHFFNLVAITSLLEMYEAQGQLKKAEQTYLHLLQMLRSQSQLPPELIAWVHIGYTRLLLEWNRLDEAEASIQQILVVNTKVLVREIVLSCCFLRFDLLLARGAYKEAWQLLGEIEDELTGKQLHQPLHELATLARTRFFLQQGKGDEALHAFNTGSFEEDVSFESLLRASTLDKYLTGEPEHFHPDFARYAILVRVRIAQIHQHPGVISLEQTLEELERLGELFERAGFTGRVIELLLLKALVLQAQNQLSQALETLERAVALAEPAGFVRLFLNEGEPLIRLLTRLLARKPSHPSAAYLRALLAAAASENAPLSAVASSPLPFPAGVPAPLEALSGREMEVLALLAGGASNQEIATRLVIAPNTAKRHVKNILGKLAASNRTQAVAHARAAGLLEPLSQNTPITTPK